MKKMQIIAWAVFLLGFILKLIHIPGASLTLVLGTLLLVIHSIIYLCKNAKTNLSTSFLHLSYSLLTVYILFRFQYWSGFSLLFLIVLFVTLFCFFLLFKNKSQFKFPQIFLVIYFWFFFALSFTRSHQIYYFFNLNTVLNAEARKTNYRVWNGYSWSLYLADKHNEALEANHKAQEAVKEQCGTTDLAFHNLELLKLNEQQILNKNWTTFHDLYLGD